MSTPEVMLFPKSQGARMHFDNQQDLIKRRKGNVLKIKAFYVSRGAEPSRGTPGNHRPDTESRLLTEMNRSRTCSAYASSAIRQPFLHPALLKSTALFR
jgi:hypothetical protein